MLRRPLVSTAVNSTVFAAVMGPKLVCVLRSTSATGSPSVADTSVDTPSAPNVTLLRG